MGIVLRVTQLSSEFSGSQRVSAHRERIRRLELEEKSRREELDRLRKEEADRIAREEAERQRREAEERARREAETRARLEAEQRAQEQLRAEEDRLRRERESRIALLEAERVRAESETLRKRQQDELLRQQMAAEEQRLARLRLEEERMAMTMQQSVDMAFLFDCTGSMQVWSELIGHTVGFVHNAEPDCVVWRPLPHSRQMQIYRLLAPRPHPDFLPTRANPNGVCRLP